jgi:murein DD-endopeptidase MepM/ murein hydrolase activator NlpD
VVTKLKVKGFVSLIFLLVLGACSVAETKVVYEIVYIYVTATHVTPTYTPTPSMTPTPTPTALPIDVSGDPRLPRLTTPSAMSGAPCGVVDLLDFPVDPPDAEDAHGGGDYGVYRPGYNGYHTGEDWWVSPGTSFGEPVYSIGHGLVTHAAPYGWGADKGTVIIKHTFPDGSSVLSFYGHLDPPSVTLRAGECVMRGDKVGEIGEPRTPPHLHFEIRTIYPTQPTRGYVSVDPTDLGWKSPSQFIFDYRNRTSPGILWMQPSETTFSKALGTIGENAFIVANGSELVCIDLRDGKTLWVESLVNSYPAFALDQNSPIIYSVSRDRQASAIQIDDPLTQSQPAMNPIDVLWQTDVEGNGQPVIIPLPGVGTTISFRDKLLGLSTEGEILWEKAPFPTVEGWSISGESLLINVEGDMPGIWSLSSSGPILQVDGLSGQALNMDGKTWIYNEDGIYLMSPEASSPRLLYPLPRAFPALGDMISLSDGSVLVAHTDIFDRRLIAFHADGTIRWEYSYSDVLPGQPILLNVGEQPYIMSYSLSSSLSKYAIFAIDIEDAELIRVFEGAARRASPRATWGFALDETRILFNLGGRSILLLDAKSALESVTALAPSP